jgi:hypothetical protein
MIRTDGADQTASAAATQGGGQGDGGAVCVVPIKETRLGAGRLMLRIFATEDLGLKPLPQ